MPYMGAISPAQDLAANHVRLAYWWARRNKHRAAEKGITLDDLAQEAVLGLLRAAQRYDPAKGEFSNYASPWIRGSIAAHMNRWRGHQGLPEDEDGRPIDPEAAEDTLTAVAETDERSHQARLVTHLLRFLRPAQCQLVRRHFGIGCERLTIQAQAAQLRISEQRMGQLLARALERLRCIARVEAYKAKRRRRTPAR